MWVSADPNKKNHGNFHEPLSLPTGLFTVSNWLRKNGSLPLTHYIPSGSLTMFNIAKWKISILKRQIIYKWGIFHSYVRLPKGRIPKSHWSIQRPWSSDQPWFDLTWCDFGMGQVTYDHMTGGISSYTSYDLGYHPGTRVWPITRCDFRKWTRFGCDLLSTAEFAQGLGCRKVQISGGFEWSWLGRFRDFHWLPCFVWQPRQRWRK